ncbi:class I poly(R)-hydroxyalkanoic acid synthase [Rubrobacter taiwanensis]|jgi:polyhydroxyalkanoate synthase|uniref:Class I poly(R)-hydroxyalkanoic acid synthase n=1 Tax=Rubrobacter taiwanensis TaxID=185139 RepID=A0A4R1BQE3_9ACTN|nr:class I poly(R)-hydroxyalkanoic acid synthase [Rubrobacter taiwanensis]TCJ19953.1 class I poly(R)-hydroxyalkanoic acid synthase [Rubrobacter taiwanensis]
MTDFRGSGGESRTSPPAAFEAWSRWLRQNTGEAAARPGAPALWPVPAGEGGGFPPAQDPLLWAVQKLWDAHPLRNILPLNWAEIIRALQVLWMREMSDPVRATERALEYNRRLFESTLEVWNEATARFWGLPRQKREGRSDRRFSAPEWESNPFYQTLKESYLLASEYLLREAEETADDRETEEQRRLRFHLKQFVDAMAPVNFLLTNPAALRRIAETGGASLAEGVRNLLADIREGRLSMTDATAFEVGENLAVTPGKVVYRNRLIELIQYEPRTGRVYEVPILFIPPWINKYYILDLRPENSMVRYLLEQGFQVFMISWKNPDASMEDTAFEDYMTLGPLAAAGVVRDITGSEKINPVGYCVGGTLLAVTLAYLAAGEGENPFHAATFMVALQDFSEVGDTAVFIDEPQIEFMEQQMLERGYLDKQDLANMFNLLRANDLIWSNIINNYLLGQKPPPFDLLYWNSDGTRMAREAHSFYLRNTYLENNLVKPGKVEIGGRPVDLGRITNEIYAVGAERDHIVPWRSAWKISRLAGGRTRFCLASSGHIAGMINPPSKGKGRHWVNESGDAGDFRTAEEWRENATEKEGSWWTDWTLWLAPLSGDKIPPPPIGSENHPPIEDAPGTYVREK